MLKFPVDASLDKVIKTFEQMGFMRVREGNHISLQRQNSDGTKTPLTLPNHRQLKSSTLRMILTQSGITREDFLKVYETI